MSSPNAISPEKLARLVGTPKCPTIVDVRTDADHAANPRFVPGSGRRSHASVADWAPTLTGQAVIVTSRDGQGLSQGVAAWLRHAGATADVLEGGIEAWTQAGLPLVPEGKLPPRDPSGRTVWVTRARPKVDRIACPWLIRRFVDPSAVFLFVAPAEVEAVAERFGGAAFDVEGVFWSHRGERCTFDVMIEEFSLSNEPLERLATIVRGADTGRPNLAPQVPGLLAASLGLSRLHTDDIAQVDAGMSLYDAFFRWCRDAVDETHNWPTNKRSQP